MGCDMASINPELRQPLEWIFENCLDEDSSGFIEQKEACMVAKYLGAGDANAFWQQMLSDVDDDGDGRISKEEYVLWMATKVRQLVSIPYIMLALLPVH